MLSFLMIYGIFQTARCQVCLLGRINDDNFNVGINGLYGDDGKYNNKNSYKKTMPTDCGLDLSTLYLFYSGNQWLIATEKGSFISFAACSQESIEDCTAGEWQVTEQSGPVDDDNVYIIDGTCPYWDCASITSTVPAGSGGTGNVNCQSFDTQIGPNTYKNSQNMYWYFNPIYQFWVCVNGDEYEYDSCTASFNARTDQGWQDLSSGNSLNIQYKLPLDNTYEITCTGNSVPSPTFAPIVNTTSDSKAFMIISMYSILMAIIGCMMV